MNFALTYIYETGDNATYLYETRESAEKDLRDNFASAVKEAEESKAVKIQCEANGDHWYIECLFPENDISQTERIDCYLTPIYFNDGNEIADEKEG